MNESLLNSASPAVAVDSLIDNWAIAAQQFGEIVALWDPHSNPEVRLTYQQLDELIKYFAAGLQSLGVKPGEKIALFSDNSPRWFIADRGLMMAGAANAVRSATAERQELLYIFRDSDSNGLIVQDLKTLQKLRPELDDLPVEFIVLLTDERIERKEPLKILNFSELIALGQNTPRQPVTLTGDSLATLIYTSGTTGKPKGVMLSHRNLMHQVNTLDAIIQPQPGDRVLSILPSWHSYERSAEYFLLARGCTQIYTNIRFFKQDLKQFKPHYMVGVPRLWESLYEGVQKQFREQSATKQRLINLFFRISERYILARRLTQNLDLDRPNPTPGEQWLARLQSLFLLPLHTLGSKLIYQQVREATGNHLKAVISGGGSLARHLDNFYEIVDLTLLVGYGLTETSPVVTARRVDRNLRWSAGSPLPYTEVRIVDPVTRQTLPPWQQGLVLLRGPQIMPGYYKQPEATAKVIDPEGWFDSGDLGMLTPNNDLVLTGRAKDTIVLTNGENIEPQPIEDACLRSPYLSQIMLVGQDQKMLGALIVPNLETLKQWAQEQKLALQLPEQGDLDRKNLDNPAIIELFRTELNREVKNRPGYRPDDRIGVFHLILEPFTIENGLMTQTLKIRRPAVSDRYRATIEGMFESK